MHIMNSWCLFCFSVWKIFVSSFILFFRLPIVWCKYYAWSHINIEFHAQNSVNIRLKQKACDVTDVDGITHFDTLLYLFYCYSTFFSAASIYVNWLNRVNLFLAQQFNIYYFYSFFEIFIISAYIIQKWSAQLRIY